jgi:hypothetical protein
VRKAREARIEAARIGDDEDARPGDGLGLWAGTAARLQLEERLVEAHSHERDDLGLQAGDLARERLSSRLDLARRQIGGRPRAARAQVREGDAELGEPSILFRGERLGNDPRREEQPPEGIARAREVMPDFGRSEARVDADEEQARMANGDVAKDHTSQSRLAILSGM